MSLSAGRMNLIGAVKELNLRWQRIRERWNDPASAEIESQFIDPLEPKARLAATAMEKMGESLTRAMRECS
jgi:hypothetical protein